MAKKAQTEPITFQYVTDSGDETQRNFRYQHAYGAILLVSGVMGKLPIKEIWCEHHEDFLACRTDDSFEAFQIKTSTPENGPWKNNDEPLQKSIKRFVELESKFSDKIVKYHFVSNTKCFDCKPDVELKTLKASPIKFLEAVRVVNKVKALSEPHLSTFNDLMTKCNCTDDALKKTLDKVVITLGPTRDAFDAEITTTFLSKISDCQNMSVAILNGIRDELIHTVYDASSMKIDDPYKYFYTSDDKDIHPAVLAKRITIDAVTNAIKNKGEIVFRYTPHGLTISLEKPEGDHYDTLTQKFLRGDIVDQLTTMKRRTISAESQLLTINAEDPEKFLEVMAQLESVVQAECDEASLAAKIALDDSTKPFGPLMLNDLLIRLKATAIDERTKVYNQNFETLMGIAGLLSENCSVWWSEKFDLSKQS